MTRSIPDLAVHRARRGVLALALGAALTGCAGATPGVTATPAAAATASPLGSGGPSSSTIPHPSLDASLDASSPGASPSDNAPDSGGATAVGDIPDNAVFLTFHGGTPPFAIQYVEGWQVTSQSDGVVIRDKDSSETVAIIGATDPSSYVSSTDLPGLQAQAGFKLVKRDTVKVGTRTYVHLAYHLPAPPDPVTGKQVPSTVDRYYVPGPAGLAVVSLSTPDGVDNVDAFRQMIESFKWA